MQAASVWLSFAGVSLPGSVAPDRKSGAALSGTRNMTIIAKVGALLTQIRRQDVEALSPFERQRFANLCRFVGQLAERQPPPQRPSSLCERRARRSTE